MATQTVTETAPTVVHTNTLPSALELVNEHSDVPAWMKQLRTRGWTVVPGVLSAEKAAHYAAQCYDWLEGWNLGFDRHDAASRQPDQLPWCIRGGLYSCYGLAHEPFVWDLKSEPAIIDAFAQIWGTDQLVVSYDGLNMSVPVPGRTATDPVYAPWAHVDQSPHRPNLQCVQGILNLLPNGPQDGGLTVLDGSSRLYQELWKHFDHKKGPTGWTTREYQQLDAEMSDWLEQQGCHWVKICAQPGDLLLWDSRTIHYGSVPSATNDRFAAYVCYKPAAFVPEAARQQRLEAFASKVGTTHDPAVVRQSERLPPADHPSYAEAVKRPLQAPVLSKRSRQLAGLEAYA